MSRNSKNPSANGTEQVLHVAPPCWHCRRWRQGKSTAFSQLRRVRPNPGTIAQARPAAALQIVRYLHWLVMIAFPPEKPKPPKVNLREELIEQLMEAKGMSREEAELAIDSAY